MVAKEIVARCVIGFCLGVSFLAIGGILAHQTPSAKKIVHTELKRIDNVASKEAKSIEKQYKDAVRYQQQ